MLRRWYDLTIYGTYADINVAKAAVTPILNQIKAYFENATADKPSPLKYVMYSGHDDTIAAHLKAIEYAGHECVLNAIITGKQEDFNTCPQHPRTSSNIIWELIDDRTGPNKSWLVKVAYNGVYLDYCRNQKKDADGYFFCTLDEFYSITQTRYTTNWETFCENPNQKDVGSSFDVLTICLMAATLIMLVVIALLGFKIKSITKMNKVMSPFPLTLLSRSSPRATTK